MSVDIKQLPVGVHYLNFRSQNSVGDWGWLNRYLFYVPESAETASHIASYEYWIDDDYSTTKRVTTSQNTMLISLDISNQSVGTHFLNFRSKDKRGNWGSLSRLLYYVPSPADVNQGSPLIGYNYRFNQQTTFVPLAESMSCQLKDLVIPIPELSEIGNLEEGCTFTFDPDKKNAHLERTQTVLFSMEFIKKSGGVSAPAVTTFNMSDELTRPVKELIMNGSVTYDKVPAGDFGVFRISSVDDIDCHLKASQQCSVWLYDESGYRLTVYQHIAKGHSVSLNLSPGTYYGIVCDMANGGKNSNSQLTLSMKPSQVEKVNNGDDLQDFIFDMCDNYEMGSAYAPVTVPIGSNSILISTDVEVEEAFSMLLDGDELENDGYLQLSFYIGTKLNLLHEDCYLKLNNAKLIITAPIAPKKVAMDVFRLNNCGIFNNGTLELSNCVQETGCLIENSGDIYIDNTVSMQYLRQRNGGRLHVSGPLNRNLNIMFESIDDVEVGVPIIMGTDDYSLTSSDVRLLRLELPKGYEWRFINGAIVVDTATGIESCEDIKTEVTDTYDLTGRRTSKARDGIVIQRLKNGTVKKAIINRK